MKLLLSAAHPTIRKRLLRDHAQSSSIRACPPELISRSEVTAMLFTFADINAIVEVLEDDQNGEQEAPEEDS